MSSSWKSLSLQRKRAIQTPPSISGRTLGVDSHSTAILRLCDAMIVNDLKDEFYYSQKDVAKEAFEAHRKVAEKNPTAYIDIVRTLRPVALESQKVLAALYLWTMDIDKELAKELLSDVRPSWKLTFFYALRRAPAFAKINGTYNRTVKAMIRDVVDQTGYYHVVKYATKLKPIVALAHLPEDTKTSFLFKKRELRRAFFRGELSVKEYADYFALRQAVSEGSVPVVVRVLENATIPYSVALGILGSKFSKDERVVRALLRLMTPWETLLGLRRMEQNGLDLNSPELFRIIQNKLNPQKLQTMRIDPVELLQAYNNVSSISMKQLLEELIDLQVTNIGTALRARLGNKKVAVVFDVSGSMQPVAEWSLVLAYALSKSLGSNAVTLAFTTSPYASSGSLDNAFILRHQINERTTLLRDIADLKRDPRLWHGTPLGSGLIAALNEQPDIIFFISDFEGNTEPWSDNVYREYKRVHGTFPEVVSIKATVTPQGAIGERTALRTGRWLGIPEETMITIRNVWDLDNILEYLYGLLPLLRKRKLLDSIAGVA